VEPYPRAELAPDTTFEGGIVATATAELDPEDEEEDPPHAASTTALTSAAPTRVSVLVARLRR
jgi:hypothetical protein